MIFQEIDKEPWLPGLVSCQSIETLQATDLKPCPLIEQRSLIYSRSCSVKQVIIFNTDSWSRT